MIKFALLASGSKGNCCLVKNGETSIVIDCGSTKTYLKKCFERLQYDVNKTDALFITHVHSDHISQLRMFADIQTYAIADLDVDHFHQISPYEDVNLHSLRVKVLPTSHDSDDSCGFVVESDTQKLVYMTDTGYISEEVKAYMQDADYYIFESNHDIEMLMETRRPMFVKQRIVGDFGHLCNEDSASVLSEVVGEKTKEIVLAHISEEGNSMELAKRTLFEALQANDVDCSKIKITSAPQFEIVLGGARK